MHPLLAPRNRFALYLTAWIPVAAILAYILSASGKLDWRESAGIVLPLCLIYALVCLSPWYLCRFLPLSAARLATILMHHFAAAVVAAAAWIALAKGSSLVFSRYLPGFDERFSPHLPLLFGVGLLLYSLAVAMHYVLLSFEASREAERREDEARVLARDAELRALKAQINPHFLFNSLNSISALTTADAARAREMCIRLSDFLRKTLSLSEKDHIPLGEEMALVRMYLDIEQVRFGSRLRVEQDTDRACERCSVPPLVLQPLVENSIKHGIAGLVEGGAVRLRVRCGGGALMVRIENEFDTEVPSPRKSGVGLANVRNRLRARHGNAAKLDVTVEGNFYRAELLIPCQDAHAT